MSRFDNFLSRSPISLYSYDNDSSEHPPNNKENNKVRPEPEKRSPKKTTNLVDKSRPFQRVDRLTQRRDPTNALDLARRQLKQATLLNHSLPLDKSKGSTTTLSESTAILSKLEKFQQQIDAQSALISELIKEKEVDREKILNLTRLITDISARVLALESNDRHPCRYMQLDDFPSNQPSGSKDTPCVVTFPELSTDGEQRSSSSYSTLTNSTRAETSNNRQSTNMERRLMRSPHVLSNCIPSVKEEEIDELKSLMEKRLYDNPSMLREIRRLLTVSKMREAPLSSYNSWRGGQELLRERVPPRAERYTQISRVEYIVPGRHDQQHRNIRITEGKRQRSGVPDYGDDRFFDEEDDC